MLILLTVFHHFCWRPRSAPSTEPEDDLIMVPGDGSFVPLTKKTDAHTSPTNGRIFVLKFSSSSSRHLFWLQSKNQHPEDKPDHYSERDLKVGAIVNDLLQGADIDVQAEIMAIGQGPSGNDDEDMQDAPPDNDLTRTSTGGAGAGATGGDVREEGAEAREGGADGGRA